MVKEITQGIWRRRDWDLYRNYLSCRVQIDPALIERHPILNEFTTINIWDIFNKLMNVIWMRERIISKTYLFFVYCKDNRFFEWWWILNVVIFPFEKWNVFFNRCVLYFVDWRNKILHKCQHNSSLRRRCSTRSFSWLWAAGLVVFLGNSWYSWRWWWIRCKSNFWIWSAIFTILIIFLFIFFFVFCLLK